MELFFTIFEPKKIADSAVKVIETDDKNRT